MRNMSFALTTDQIRARTKTVTRRLGWKTLRTGQLIRACVKCMGLKPGEQIERLAVLKVARVTREPLERCDDADAAREGFPQMSGQEFVARFCRHMGGEPSQVVTRIEFQYVPGGREANVTSDLEDLITATGRGGIHEETEDPDLGRWESDGGAAPSEDPE